MKNILVVVVLIGMLAGFGALGYGYHLTVGMETKPKQVGFAFIATAWTLAFIPIVRRVAGAVPPGESAELRAARKRAKAQAERLTGLVAERRRARIAELEADPRRRKYIPEVMRGRMLTDAEIDYVENPEMTLACEHLAPVELAMRRAGIDCRPQVDIAFGELMSIMCSCRLDFEKLDQTMELAPSLAFHRYFYDRDGPDVQLSCKACNSTLWMDERREYPQFPA